MTDRLDRIPDRIKPLACASAVVAVTLIIGLPLAAQTHTSKISVPDDLVVRQQLSKADDAATQGDVERAIRIWQDTLDRMASKVVEAYRAPRLGTETDTVIYQDRFVGVRTWVMKRILEFPDNGIGRYRELMEPKAEQMLSEGVARRDEAILRECVLRYSLAPSGLNAYLALTDLYLEAGRFAEARLCCQRLQAEARFHPDATSLGTWVAAREGLALFGSGRYDELSNLLEQAPKDEGDVIAVAGNPTSLRTFLASLVEQVPSLSEETTSPPALIVFRDRSWYRGLRRHTGQTSPRVRFIGQPNYLLNHYPVVPTIEGGVVYGCDGLSIFAKSLFTGDDIWPPVDGIRGDYAGGRNRNLYYHMTVDGDLAFGYLQGEPIMEGRPALQGFQPIETIPSYKLVAVDVNTGDIAWTHLAFSGRTPDESAFIKRLTVNQPPLVIGDTVYVAGTVLLGIFHQWVCAFERDTGHLKWRTYTGAGQMELNMFGNAIKEAIPGHLAEHDGVLYYSTNIGAICAVDAVTGAIVWEVAYDQEGIPSTDSPQTQERQPGWMPSAPAIWGDYLFVAPTDSLDLYKVTLATGELIPVRLGQRTPQTRNYYFLGIHGGVVIVAGARLTAIDPETLTKRWDTVDGGRGGWDQPTIRGLPAVVGNDVIFGVNQSDRTADLYRVDIVTGRVKERGALSVPGREGNIVVSPDAVVVAGEDAIQAYFDLDAVRDRLIDATKGGQANPELLMRLGDVFRRRGQWAEALNTFERARDRALSLGPRGRLVERRATLALYNGWLAMAAEPARPITGGPSGAEARFQVALTHARTEGQRVRVLLDTLDWALGAADNAAFKRAADTLMNEHAAHWVDMRGRVQQLLMLLPAETRMPAGLLAALATAARAEQERNWSAAVDAYHFAQTTYADIPLDTTSAWRFAGTRIEHIMKSGGPGVYARQEAMAKKLLAEALERNDQAGIRAVLRDFPQSSVVDTAYLELSRRLLDEGEFGAALGEMQQYFARFGNPSPAALFEYGRCLDRLGAHDSALQVMLALDRLHPTASVRSGEGNIRVRGWLTKLLEGPPYADLVKDPVRPTVELGLQVAWTRASENQEEPLTLLATEGRIPESAAGLALLHMDGKLVALDARTGAMQWSKSSASVANPIWHDGRLVTTLDQDIVSLDPTSGKEHWRNRVDDGSIRNLRCGHGKVYVLVSSLIPEGLGMRTLDITSGQERQRRLVRGTRDGSLSISPSYVLIRIPNRGRAICLDAITEEQVGDTINFGRDAPPPFLTNDDTIILTEVPATSSAQPVRIMALKPSAEAGKNLIWSFEPGRGRVQSHSDDTDPFIFEVQASSLVVGTSAQPPRSLIVLDLKTGRPRFKTDLDRNQFSMNALASADHVYVNIHEIPIAQRGEGSQRIAAYDMRRGSSPWSTAQFGGPNLSLEMYPTQGYLLLRKGIMRTSARTRPDEMAELYYVDERTGKVVDLITLGPPRPTSGMVGMVVRNGALVMTNGSEVKGWLK